MRQMIQFYENSIKHSKSENTVEHYAEVLDRIFQEMESLGVQMTESRITGLDGKTLQKWFNTLCDQVKPATVNNYVITLNGFLRWVATMSEEVDGEDIPYIKKDFSNVLHTIPIPDADKLPPEERPKEKYYTHEQVNELLYGNHGRNQVRDRAIMALILYSGLRVSELCSLTVGQFRNAPRGKVQIRRKGGRWTTAVIGEEAYPFIEAYLATRSDLDNPDHPLFMTTHGKPCNRNQLYRALAFKQKEVDVATGPHAFRHTFVSELGNQSGASIARDCANHKSMHVTNRYSHTTEDQRQEAVNGLHW